MKKKITIRFVSVVLCLAMMFTCLQVSATALTLEDVEQVFNKLAHYTVDDLPKNLRRHLNSGWSRATLDKTDADNENVLTTVNADGSKTLYSYDSPIKFVDEEGYVRFIDSSLKPCVKADGLFDWYSYENTANDIKTYFPLFIKTGVLVEGEQGDIRMTPKDARNSLSSKIDEGNNEYVLYEDVFDKGVDIRYTAINEGVKEDIILEAYNGDNTFEYIVEAEGLTPVRNEGKTVEFIDGDMQTAYTLGEIVLFDSAEVPATNSNNSYTVEELKDGKYLVTLVIDEEFLTDENTVYPVIVDPSLTEKCYKSSTVYASYYKNIITDSNSSKEIDENYASVGSLTQIISGETTYSNAITYMRLTDFSPFVHINPANITEANLTLNIYNDTMPANPDLTITAYNFDYVPSYTGWDWADANRYSSHFPSEEDPTEYWRSRYQLGDEKLTVGDNTLTLDILGLFKQWLNSKTKYYWNDGTVHHNDGFFITAPKYTESRFKIWSTQTSSAPSITVTYDEDISLDDGYYYIQAGYYYDPEVYPVNLSRYLTANEDGSITIEDYTGNANQIWHIRCLDRTSNNGEFLGDYSLYNMGKWGYLYTSSYGERIGLVATTNTYQSSECQFKILDQSNGYKRIVKKTQNTTIAVKNYEKESGSIVVNESVNGLDCQRWNIKAVDKLAIPIGDDTINMVAGEQKHLDYSLVNGAQIESISSNNNGVVYVKNGYLVANSQGTATVTAVATVTTSTGTLRLPTTWTVHVDPQTVTISEPTLELEVGDVHFLEANTEPLGLSVTWSSENDDIATVNPQTGKVTAVGVGTTTIKATIAGGAPPASCTVKVNYCGGSNYRDVNRHTLELHDDGYYVCSVCGYRIKSPALQDEDVLNESDYLTVVSLLHEYLSIVHEYPIYAEKMLAMIDAIRGLPENNTKYEYCDQAGVYAPEYNKHFGNVDMYINVDKGTCVRDYVLFKSLYTIAGAVAPFPYSVMISAIGDLVALEHPGVTQMTGADIINNYASYLADGIVSVPSEFELELLGKVKSAAEIYFVLTNASSEITCTSDCYNVVITICSKEEEYDCHTASYHFSDGVDTMGRWSEYNVDGLKEVEPDADYYDNVNDREYDVYVE